MTRGRVSADVPLYFGLSVWLCAAILFPLHLGWTGVSPLEFVSFLLVATLLVSWGDASENGLAYPNWGEVSIQTLLRFIALSVPAALMFFIGAFAGTDATTAPSEGIQQAHQRASHESQGEA